MRRVLVLIAFLVSLALSGAPTIIVSPASPRAGQPVTFALAGAPPVTGLAWIYGDDPGSDGSSVATHIYAKEGRYEVRALWTYVAGGFGTTSTFITVGPGYQKGPSAPFNLTSIILRWKEGQSSLAVPKGTEKLMAYADIKFEGTGPFQAQWLVDGQVVSVVSRTLSFAGKVTLDSGTTPGLPTSIPGPHDVTLRILNPSVSFTLPVIRYVVSLDAPQPPRPSWTASTPPSSARARRWKSRSPDRTSPPR
jgi:uncharacterized protein YceK